MKQSFTSKFHKTLNAVSGFITNQVKIITEYMFESTFGFNIFLRAIVGLNYN